MTQFTDGSIQINLEADTDCSGDERISGHVIYYDAQLNRHYLILKSQLIRDEIIIEFFNN